jgi:hypothetical protein
MQVRGHHPPNPGPSHLKPDRAEPFPAQGLAPLSSPPVTTSPHLPTMDESPPKRTSR